MPSLIDHDNADGQGKMFQTIEPFAARYPSALDSVSVLRGEVTAIATRRGLTGTGLSDVALAMSEAATNAVVHGSKLPEAVIRLSVAFEGGSMQVVVSDDGRGMGRSPHVSDRGYGLRIIRSVTKGDVAFLSGSRGTAVHMNFECPARAQYASLVRRRRTAAPGGGA